MRMKSGGAWEVASDDVFFGGVAVDTFGDDAVGDVFEVVTEGGACRLYPSDAADE